MVDLRTPFRHPKPNIILVERQIIEAPRKHLNNNDEEGRGKRIPLLHSPRGQKKAMGLTIDEDRVQIVRD